MRSLYMDTAGTAILALKDGGEVRRAEIPAGRDRSGELFAALDGLLGTDGVRGLDFMVAITGPGSFTGIRIGLSIAKGFQIAAGLPVIGISAFRALFITHARPGAKRYSVVIPAGSGESYVAVLDAKGDEAGPPAIVATASIKLSGAVIRDWDGPPDPGKILAFAENLVASGTPLPPLVPTYVKPHYAEIKKHCIEP